MKAIVTAVLLNLACIGATSVSAQGTEAVRGDYVGPYKYTNYETGAKAKKNMGLTVEANSVVRMAFTDDLGITWVLPGQGRVSGKYLYINVPFNINTRYSGRLEFKGKPGKQSLSGTIHRIDGVYVSTSEMAVRLKPPKK